MSPVRSLICFILLAVHSLTPLLSVLQELEPLLAPLKEEMSEAGYKHRTLYDLFVSRVGRYLHVVLSMDPSNPSFQTRCESNPALYTRCSMLWMTGEQPKYSKR